MKLRVVHSWENVTAGFRQQRTTYRRQKKNQFFRKAYCTCQNWTMMAINHQSPHHPGHLSTIRTLYWFVDIRHHEASLTTHDISLINIQNNEKEVCPYILP
eukprot:scaffold3826_cov273-Chaetoceros_neogracile.AAC.12